MSTITALGFAAGAPVVVGAWPLTVTPAAVATVALPRPVPVAGIATDRTDAWKPAAGDTLSIDTRANAAVLGEFSLEVWITDLSLVEPVALVTGTGSPVDLSLAAAAPGTVVVTAAIDTTGAPLVLVSPPIPTEAGAILRLGVWVSGSEAVLTAQGAVVRRLRFARTIPDARGDLVVAGPAAGSASILSVVAVILGDQLDASQEAAMSDAAAAGLGEIDSLVASGVAGDLGAPLGDEEALGRMRWRAFARGTVYWSENTGAHAVREGIAVTYAARGGALGRLGLPTSDEMSVDAALDRLRAPRRPSMKSGLTAFDVIAQAGALSAADVVVTYDAPKKPPRPPRARRTWDELVTTDLTAPGAPSALRPGLGAAWVADALGHRVAGAGEDATIVDPELRALIDQERQAGAFGIGRSATARRGRVGLRRDAARVVRSGDAARLRPGLAISVAADAGRLERADAARVLQHGGEGGELTLRLRRGSVSDDLRVEPTAVPVLLGRIGEQLAAGTISAAQATDLAPQLRLRHPAVDALVGDLAAGGDQRPLVLTEGRKPTLIGDLLRDSALVGSSVSFEVNGAIWDLLGPRAQLFQHGIIVFSRGSGGIDVSEQILAQWAMLGGSRGFLGVPRVAEAPVTGGPQAWADGGRVVVFGGGRIYWSAATGAHEVHGAILDRYLQRSSDAPLLFVPTIGEILGLPLSDEESIPGFGAARRSIFQRGHIYWTPEQGAIEVGADILGQFTATGGISRWGLPTGVAQTRADGGMTLVHQPFARGRIAIVKDASGAIRALTSLEVGIAKVTSGDIDDDTLFVPNRDAELIVKAQVFVDGRRVLDRSSEDAGHDSRVVQPGWVTPPIDTATASSIRIYIEAWDWDAGPNDLLATYDRTFTADDDFFGYAVPGSWGSHLSAASTWNGPDASASAITFDFTVGRVVPVSLARMREDHFWRVANASRKLLPWKMYRDTFDDIDSDTESGADVFERSTFDDRYETVADGGNCFGFSSTALDAFHKRGGIPQPLSDKNLVIADDNTYWQAINRGQGSQICAAVGEWRVDAKDDDDFCDPRRVYDRVVAAIRDTGAPVILCFWMKDVATGKGAGHAVLVYGCATTPGVRTLSIADSNQPWPVPNATSRIEVYDDGSYMVFPGYAGWAGSAWVSGSLGDQYMIDVPSWTLSQPLRSPAFDLGSGLFGLLGGVVTSTGAAVAQVEGGGRRLYGDQRRQLADQYVARNSLLEAVAHAGLVRAEADAPPVGDPIVDSAVGASQRVAAALDRDRLAATANLVAPGLVGAELSASLAAAVARVPAAAAASTSWGAVQPVSSSLIGALAVGGAAAAVLTPGVWPGVADISPADDRLGGPAVIGFRGAVPRDLAVTLRGRGERYVQTMAARGGVIRVESVLDDGRTDVLGAVALSSFRPGLVIRTDGGDRVAAVAFSATAGTTGTTPVSWSVPLGIGPTDASVRWLPGRPGLVVRHVSAVPAGPWAWGGARGIQHYAVSGSQPGETVRVVPDDPASPFGAIRVQRLSVVGDLLESEVVDPTG